MKVWLDDERPMPPGYDIHVRTAAEAIRLLSQDKVTGISLDHDLGEHAGTGYEVACYIEQAAYEGVLPALDITIHSANPVGRERMEQACSRAMEFWKRRGSV